MTSRVQPGPLVPPKPNGTRFPNLMNPADDPKVELCARFDFYEYDLTTAAVFLVYIVFGVLYTFLGKFFFLNLKLTPHYNNKICYNRVL